MQTYGCYVSTTSPTYPLAFAANGSMRAGGSITVEANGMYNSKQASLEARCRIFAVHIVKKSDASTQHTCLVETYNGTTWITLFQISVTADSVEFVGQPGEFGPYGIYTNGGFRVTLDSANIAALVIHGPA